MCIQGGVNMSFYGIGSGSDSLFTQFFGNTNQTTNNSMFSVSLSDWSMIKGGTYKKLMNAYYNADTSNTVSSAGDKNSAGSISKDVGVAGNDAGVLVKAIDKLSAKVKEIASQNESSDESSKSRLMDELYKAVSEYVDAYNNMLESVPKVDNNSMLRNELLITRSTTANSKLLDKIGVEIGSDNSLSVDEKTFKQANMSDISTLFGIRGSYISGVSTKALMIGNSASAMIATSSKAYTYTNKGTYSNLIQGKFDSYN